MPAGKRSTIDRALLRIPADRTKEGRPHNVPLSGPVLAVLADAWERTGGVGLVFPSATGRPISPATLRKLLRALGVGLAPRMVCEPPIAPGWPNTAYPTRWPS